MPFESACRASQSPCRQLSQWEEPRTLAPRNDTGGRRLQVCQCAPANATGSQICHCAAWPPFGRAGSSRLRGKISPPLDCYCHSKVPRPLQSPSVTALQWESQGRLLLGMTRKGGACHSGDGLSLSAAPSCPFLPKFFLHTPCAMCRSFLFTAFRPIFPHKPCSERSPFSTAPCAWPRIGISGLAGLLHISFAYGLRIKIILPIFSDRESECCYEVYL